MFEQRILWNYQFLFGKYKSSSAISSINGEYKYAKTLFGLTLSFRQINHFIFSSNSITFNFYGLTTTSLSSGYQIFLYLYLIKQDGTLDTTLQQATCTLDNAVNPTDGQIQADFSCQLNGLTGTYTSFILSYSDNVAGIPKEEILLNPIKTNEAITGGYLLDYSVEENKGKLPSIFTPSSINGNSWIYY